MRRLVVVLGVLCVPGLAFAQPVGTFRWQSQPFCNVITLAVTRVGTTFRSGRGAATHWTQIPRGGVQAVGN
jgi:hypothetical protein